MLEVILSLLTLISLGIALTVDMERKITIGLSLIVCLTCMTLVAIFSIDDIIEASQEVYIYDPLSTHGNNLG